MFLGLALLISLFSDMSATQPHGGLSTIITSTQSPTALQQLATFHALQQEAEEEHLDWGSAGVLSVRPTITHKPRGAVSLDAIERDSDSNSGSASNEMLMTEEGESSASTKSSRRRPHRRQHRKTGSAPSISSCSVAGVSGSAVALPLSSPSVHTHRIWSQLHILEVACSTQSNNFIHTTERFTQYRLLYPIVYRCHLREVPPCPTEVELLQTAITGVEASRRWSCENCGAAHSEVRESCLRCRAPSAYARLLFGQTLQGMKCSPSLIRFLHASLPEVRLHRVECHMDADNRGRGCASVYVSRGDAKKVIDMLHLNVFFDIDGDSGEAVAHYVYSEQQEWLQAFAEVRAATAGGSTFLPTGPLVVEESTAASVKQTAQHRRRLRQQQRKAWLKHANILPVAAASDIGRSLAEACE